MPPIHWSEILRFTVSPLELFLRGSVVYLVILALMRILRREPGAIGITDLLMLVLIADASQNAMSAEYKSVPDGLVLVSTLFFWNYMLDWLAFRVEFVSRIINAEPVPLIRNGRLQRQNMRRQLIREDQLDSVLREHGVERASDVRLAFLEGDGQISVIKFEEENEAEEPQDHRKAI